MNYAAHYNRLIERARHRVLEGYRERHHILPKCMGGDDSSSNLVDLTAEEHYVAHQLLVQMNPSVKTLAHAAMMMSVRCSGNKPYGWLRRRNAMALRGNKYGLGHKKSQKEIDRMSALNRGKILSAETRAKITAARIGKPLSPEHRAKVSASLIGNKRSLGTKHSAESRAKISSSLRRLKRAPHSTETKAKIGNANRGRSPSQETRAKMSAAHLGRPHSTKHRANLAAANRARWERQKSYFTPA